MQQEAPSSQQSFSEEDAFIFLSGQLSDELQQEVQQVPPIAHLPSLQQSGIPQHSSQLSQQSLFACVEAEAVEIVEESVNDSC
ncbi:MAG: hypothetical protein RML33_02430 [Acidobacteriota bacterium]|nr:hypothetical protein [Acidobacteriota bacterium]